MTPSEYLSKHAIHIPDGDIEKAERVVKWSGMEKTRDFNFPQRNYLVITESGLKPGKINNINERFSKTNNRTLVDYQDWYNEFIRPKEQEEAKEEKWPTREELLEGKLIIVNSKEDAIKCRQILTNHYSLPKEDFGWLDTFEIREWPIHMGLNTSGGAWWQSHSNRKNHNDFMFTNFSPPSIEKENIIGYKHKATGKEVIGLDVVSAKTKVKIVYSEDGKNFDYDNHFEWPKEFFEKDFEPIYAPKETILTLGSGNRKFKISRGKIEVEKGEPCGGWQTWRLSDIRNGFNNHLQNSEVQSIKVHGDTYTREDQNKIIDTYNHLNK